MYFGHPVKSPVSREKDLLNLSKLIAMLVYFQTPYYFQVSRSVLVILGLRA